MNQGHKARLRMAADILEMRAAGLVNDAADLDALATEIDVEPDGAYTAAECIEFAAGLREMADRIRRRAAWMNRQGAE
jgi:hypothetical protein